MYCVENMARIIGLEGRWITSRLVVVIILGFSPGLCEFDFNVQPESIYNVVLDSNMAFDCSTNDANATTQLFFRKYPGRPWINEITPRPMKVLKVGDVFTILHISLKDLGQYQCRATNQTGNTIRWDKSKGMLFAKSVIVPVVNISPKDAVVLATGQSANITCKSSLHTTLKWLKGPKSGPQVDVPASQTASATNRDANEVTLVLMIKNAKLSDSSKYECVMTYKSTTSSVLASVTVYALEKPTITAHSKGLTVKERNNPEIECSAKAYPALQSFKWYKNGNEISIPKCAVSSFNPTCEDIKYRLTLKTNIVTESTALLKIKNIQYPADHGEYVCVAKNSIGTAMAKVSIDVEAKPVLSTERDVFLEVKDLKAEVKCKVLRSNPSATFTWQYQSDSLCPKCPPKEDKWTVLPKYTVRPPVGVATNISTVFIPPKQDPAYFRCIAKNKIGASNWTVEYQHMDDPCKDNVNIKYPPKNPSPFQVNENDPIKIHCIVCKQLAILTSSGIQWLHGKGILSTSTDLRVNIDKAQISPDFFRVILTIVNSTVNDSGIYTCDAVGLKPTRVINDTVRITVLELEPPKISGLEDKTVKREDVAKIELPCKTTGNPPPKIQWFIENGTKELPNIPDLVKASSCKQSKSGYFYYADSEGSPLVICQPTHALHSGTYTCVATNQEGRDQATATLDVQEGASIISPKSQKVPLDVGAPLNRTCIAGGNPIPEVQWMITGDTGTPTMLAKGSGKALLVVDKVNAEINYTCTASNYGSDSIVLTVEFIDTGGTSAPVLSKAELAGVISGCVIFLLIMITVFLVMYRRQREQIKEYREIYFQRTGQSDYKLDPDRSLLEQCNDLPYDHDFEFPEERLILGKILGQGAFGQVLRAEAIGMAAFYPRDKSAEAFGQRAKLRRSMRKSRKGSEYNSMRTSKTTVAVKCLKEGAGENEYKDLASELKILIHVGEHKNIVNVLGACTRGRRLMVIIEFAPYGNLLNFLRERREVYQPTWTKTTMDLDVQYTLVDLAMAAYQVSRGAEFLASRKCVHRDLAARNVLVGPDYVMKVSDFGLARDIHQDDLYVKTTSGLLPVKWMAPESLFDRAYTEKTDVWSFGILLWEMFTLGGTPYPGLPTEQLLDYLSEGQRMAQPQNCPLDLYAIMRDCWMQLPEQRPDFITLADRLGKVLERNIAKDNPYIQVIADEDTGTTDYYLTPCDANLQRKRTQMTDGYEEPVPTPHGQSSSRYDSPLPSLPPNMIDVSDEEIANSPLPSIPPSYDEDLKSPNGGCRSGSRNSNESGIDMEEKGRKAEEERLLGDLPDEHGYDDVIVESGPGKGKGKKNKCETLV